MGILARNGPLFNILLFCVDFIVTTVGHAVCFDSTDSKTIILCTEYKLFTVFTITNH